MKGDKISHAVIIFVALGLVVLGISSAIAAYSPYDIEAITVAFMPNGVGASRHEVNIWTKGEILASIRNNTGNAVNVELAVELDGVVIKTWTLNNFSEQHSYDLSIPDKEMGGVGSHTLRLVVDPQNKIAESNENNNIVTSQVTVVTPYDIQAESIVFIPDNNQGQPTDEVLDGLKGTIKATLKNLTGDSVDVRAIMRVDNTIIKTSDLKRLSSTAPYELIITGVDLGALGEHIITLTVDPEQKVPEKNENNNIISRTVKVVPAYDIKAKSILFIPDNNERHPASEVTPAQKTGDLYVTMDNVADIPVTFQATLQQDGRVIRTWTLNNAQGHNIVKGANIDLGSVGNHTLRLVVDPQNQVKETDENNNAVSKTIKVNTGCDYWVESLGFYPDDDPSGQPAYRISVAQLGSIRGVVKSANNMCHGGTLNVALEVEGKTIRTFTEQINSDGSIPVLQQSGQTFLVPGAYTMRLTIDPQNRILETNESNNQMSNVIEAQTLLGDYVARTIMFFHATSGGSTEVVPYGVKGWIEFYLSNAVAGQPELPVQVAIDLDGRRLQTFTVNNPNLAHAIAGPSNVDLGALGRHTLKMIVDPADQFKELDESNNEFTRILTVVSQYDIKADSIEFVPNEKQAGDKRDEVVAGTKGTIVAKMSNLTGNPVDVQVAIELDGRRIHTAVRNKMSGLAQIEVKNIGLGGVGIHTLRLVVDPANQVSEQNENNNTVSRTVKVVSADSGSGRRTKTKEDQEKSETEKLKAIPEESAKRDVLKAPSLKPAGK